MIPLFSTTTDVRTYAVVPLNEDCGIIQWVNNTVAFRHALNKIYEADGITPKVKIGDK